MKPTLLLFSLLFIFNILVFAQFRGKLQYTYVGDTTLDMKIDLSRNHRVKVKNISATPVSGIITEFNGLNADGSVVTTGGGGFAVFPNGGTVNLAVGDSVVVQGWSRGWFECTNCTLATGNNSKKVRFIFSQNGTADRDTLIQDITVINNSDATVNALSYVTTGGSYAIKGAFKLPAYFKDSVQSITFYLQNSNSNNKEWQITPASATTSAFGDQYYHFNFTAVSRNDWRIQARTVVKSGIKWFIPNTNVPVTGSGTAFLGRIAPFGVGNFAIDSVRTYQTQTGFWRGVFVPADSSLIVFPGQENWNNASINKLNSRMYKLKLNNANFGDTAWTYLIGDETWGGAASKDGRYAVYLLNQGGADRTNVTKDWVGIINTITGVKIWGSGGNLPINIYEGLEVAMSKDGRYFAIGTTGNGVVTLFENNHAVNGTATVTQLWQMPCTGQVRKIVFSDDGQHLYTGSGDMFLRKFKISDGTLVWKAYIGGWPFINGLKFSTDSTYIYTGTKSFDITKVNVLTGEVTWSAFSGNLDVYNSSNGKYVMDFSGQLVDNSTGAIVGKIQPSSQKAFAYLDDFVISGDRGIDIYHPFGSLRASRSTYMDDGSGEQSQYNWVDSTGTKIVVLARDMVSNGPPKNGIGCWRITPVINRYPTLDSISNLTVSTGDSVYTILRYADRDAHAITVTASATSANLVLRMGTNDTLWMRPAGGHTGTDTVTVSIRESATTEKFLVYNKFTITASCASTAAATATAAATTSFCTGGSVVLNANTGTGLSYQWLKDATAITSATAASYTATASGSYTVTVTNAGGCSTTSSAIVVTVNTLPAATITAATTTTICAGSSVLLNANTGTGFTYQWLKDAVNISGATTVSYTATTSGNYTVTITNSNACSATSTATVVTVVTIPSAPTVVGVTYCQGVTAPVLAGTASSGNSLLWYTVASGGTGSATAPTPSTATAGTVDYYVSQLTATGSCESARSKLTVIVKSSPSTPTIVRDTAHNLVSSAIIGNLWYKDGIALSDTTQKYKPTTAANYSVKTTQNGCASNMSANYYYLVTALVNFLNNQYLILYPNPTREDIRIDYKLDGQYQLNIKMYALNGKLVLKEDKISSGTPVSLKSLSRAIYLVMVSDKNGKLMYTDKIIKE